MSSKYLPKSSPPQTDTVAQRLRQAGLQLPQVVPNGRYQLAVVADTLVFAAGQLSRRSGEIIRRAEPTPSISVFRDAAQVAALRAIAALASAVDLERIERLVSMTGYLAVPADYEDHSPVMDAASDTLLTIFGARRGAHVRTSVGVASLPAGGLVEIELSAILQTI